MTILILVGACHLARTLPEAVPLDFSCQAQIEKEVLDLTQQTKITLTLTPNNEGTQASSLSLTEWHLPEGIHGFLLDADGKAITTNTPLAWGEHVWHYSPHNVGAHIITLQVGAAQDESPVKLPLPTIQVMGGEATTSAKNTLPLAGDLNPYKCCPVSAWMRALTVEEQSQVEVSNKVVVALSIRIDDDAALQDTSFKLHGWQLPEGVEGVLQNASGDRLQAFPLKAHQTNTLFLTLTQGLRLEELRESMHLWIQGPGGSQHCLVPMGGAHQELPFHLSMTTPSTALLSHEQLPFTVTIAPRSPHDKSTYTLTALSLSHGTLQGASSGIVLKAGAQLVAGAQEFLFTDQKPQSRLWRLPWKRIPSVSTVKLQLTVSNEQGACRHLEQVFQVQRPGFAVSAWMRPLTAAEQQQAGHQWSEVMAVELRIEKLPPDLPPSTFELHRWQLPRGVQGVLKNASWEALKTFPLKSQERPVFFLCLSKSTNLEKKRWHFRSSKTLRLWVEGPGGYEQSCVVPLHGVHRKVSFDVGLQADRASLLHGEELPVTLTIRPPDNQQKNQYSLKSLTPIGSLKSATTGQVLVPGTKLAPGIHALLFTPQGPSLRAEQQVKLSLSLCNDRGEHKRVIQRLSIHPAQFTLQAWLRPLIEESQSQGAAMVALEVKLSGVPDSLQGEAFTLHGWQLPSGLQGHLMSEAREPLRSFPISARRTNTFLLAFKLGQVMERVDPVLSLQVQGPCRRLIEGRVDCALVQEKLLKSHLERLLGQMRPGEVSSVATNRALLSAIEGLKRYGPIPPSISQSLKAMGPALASAEALQSAEATYGEDHQAVLGLCVKDSLDDQEREALKGILEVKSDMLVGDGHRPLRVAAYHSNLDAVRVILNIPQAIGKDVETPHSTLLSGFMDACYAESRSTQAAVAHFEAIFDALIEVSSIRDECNGIGRTPLMHASGMGSLELLKKLVNKGVEVTAKTTKRSDYRVHCAVARSRAVWFDDNTRGGMLLGVKGWTALHEATAHQHAACVTFLNTVSEDWSSADSTSYRFRGKDYKAPWVRLYEDGFYLP